MTNRPFQGLFDVVAPADRLAAEFLIVRDSAGHAPTRAMMDRVFAQMGDRDGNFCEQFQTTGFDARVWELFLYAVLTDAANEVDLAHAIPDFVLTRHGGWSLEATTASAGKEPRRAAPTDPGQRQRYMEQELPIRLGSPLYSKLKKRYWDKPQVAGKPFAIALESFASADALTFSETAVTEYLFGIRTIWERGPAGELVIHHASVAEHRLEGKVIPSGFFSAPDAEHLAAVVFSNQGTVAKFGRMGFQEGLASTNLRMVREGLRMVHDPDASLPAPFIYEVGSRWERWGEGVAVIHNPNALHPLPSDALPDAVHYRREDEHVVSTSRSSFHAFESTTTTFVLSPG